MIEDGIHVWREHSLIGIVHLDGRVRPPQESLRQRGAVAHASLYFKIGTAGPERKAGGTFLVEHPLHLVHPHRHRAVFVLDDVAIDGQIG